MVVKFFSCVCAVGAGLPIGPEGPMIHLGYDIIKSEQGYPLHRLDFRGFPRHEGRAVTVSQLAIDKWLAKGSKKKDIAVRSGQSYVAPLLDLSKKKKE